MFSMVNRYQTRNELFANLIKLDEEEKNELEKAEKTILSGSRKAKLLLAEEVLTDFNNIEKVFKFAANSEYFKAFCLQDEFSHVNTWRKVLTLLDYPAENIISLDRKEMIFVFDQYLGAYFFGKYLRFKQGDKSISSAQAGLYLDLACEKGLFSALLARCEYNQWRLKNTNISNSAQADALAQIRTDTKRLGNLYWVVGLLHASLVLLDLGNYFANVESDEADMLGHALQEKAAKRFLQARELANYKALDQNEKIIKNICGKDGLTVFEFNDWDAVQSFFLSHVDDSRSPHAELILNAKKEIRKYVNVSRNSSLKVSKKQGS